MEEKELASKDLVVVANNLVRGSQEHIGVTEAKLLRLIISNISKTDTELFTYTCSASDLAEYLNIDPRAIYAEIDKITTNLFGRVIKIFNGKRDKNGNMGYEKINWVQKCSYSEGKLTVQLSNQLKPYLLGLKSMYTAYLYSNVKLLSSTYSIRLYELVMSFINANESPETRVYNPAGPDLDDNQFQFDIDYLRKYFDCEINDKTNKPKYPNASDFVKRVIEPSVNDINEKLVLSGPHIEFEAIKEGRKIKAIIFTVDKKMAKTKITDD